VTLSVAVALKVKLPGAIRLVLLALSVTDGATSSMFTQTATWFDHVSFSELIGNLRCVIEEAIVLAAAVVFFVADVLATWLLQRKIENALIAPGQRKISRHFARRTRR
jgi:hypothetical protein